MGSLLGRGFSWELGGVGWGEGDLPDSLGEAVDGHGRVVASAEGNYSTALMRVVSMCVLL